MADTNMTAEERRYNEPVCIDARRIYDSCSDKDCMSDLPVFFTLGAQEKIDDAVNIRLRDADIINVSLDVEPVPFHRGFYSVDITYFFKVTLDAFCAPNVPPVPVCGFCMADKKVILYGSEGSVRVFSSEFADDEYDPQNPPMTTMPIANVQVAQPIALASCIKEKRPCCPVPRRIPAAVTASIGGEITESGEKTVFATLGVFSIVQLMRNVQMLIPSYDYCIPEKSCTFSDDSPCEMFSRLDFPTDEFFPPSVMDTSSDNGCGCAGSCGNN